MQLNIQIKRQIDPGLHFITRTTNFPVSSGLASELDNNFHIVLIFILVCFLIIILFLLIVPYISD